MVLLYFNDVNYSSEGIMISTAFVFVFVFFLFKNMYLSIVIYCTTLQNIGVT